MKRYLMGGAIIFALAVGVYAGSYEGEFSWYKVTGPGPHHVDVVSGHGKNCDVFAEDSGSRTVLLWCEDGPPPRQNQN